MLLSCGVVWRHRTRDEFRRECPGGNKGLQRQIVERLDDALDWLESLGAPVVARETPNPRIVGRRVDPRGVARALADRARDVHPGPPPGYDDGTRPEAPTVLATGRTA